MSTSGSFSWSLNQEQVITSALRKLAVLPSGGSPSTNQYNDASDALNSLVKAFAADGMPLWSVVTKQWGLSQGVPIYTVGPGEDVGFDVAPLKVFQATYITSDGTRNPVTLLTEYDYNLLPTDAGSGPIVNVFYQNRFYGTGEFSLDFLPSTGILKVWPSPDDPSPILEVTCQLPFEDMVNQNDDFSFPSYWMQALIYNLAWALAPEYGIPPTDRGVLQKEAMYWKDQALSYGSEEGSMYMQPDWQGNYKG